MWFGVASTGWGPSCAISTRVRGNTTWARLPMSFTSSHNRSPDAHVNSPSVNSLVASSTRETTRRHYRHNPRMAYDEALAERIRPLVDARGDVTERKMFGGIAWMLQGNMACGVIGDDVCVRMAPEDAEQALREPQTRQFEMMAGRPAKNMVVVDGAAVAEEDALARWVNAGADFALSLPPK